MDAAFAALADRELIQRVIARARGHTSGDPAFAPLRAMLLAQRVQASEELEELAHAIAVACMGGHHLWQDLGCSGRAEVSRLMELGFPALFAANVHDLRWKRHLFLCLGQHLGRPGMRPPKCDHCGDFASCMGAPAPPPALPGLVAWLHEP